MSWLSRLFGGQSDGGKPDKDPEPQAVEEYKGFRIIPGPIREGGQYRVAVRIEKTVDGTVRQHQVIRADMLSSLEEATTISAAKARQVIDEQGERIFAA